MAASQQMQLTMLPLGENFDAAEIIQKIADSTRDSLQIGILHDFNCPQSDRILYRVWNNPKFT